MAEPLSHEVIVKHYQTFGPCWICAGLSPDQVERELLPAVHSSCVGQWVNKLMTAGPRPTPEQIAARPDMSRKSVEEINARAKPQGS